MKTWFYSWVVYPFCITIAKLIGFFNSKIRKTIELRSWEHFLSFRYNRVDKIEYWIHVASTGELEYAIPVIEELNKRSLKVLVTYYSISAKDSVEKLPGLYKNVSLVVPLPHDGMGLMKNFVKLLRKQGVKILLILKYELWPGLLWECNRNEIKIFLIDALKPSWFHKRLIHKLSGILTGYNSETIGIQHRFVQNVGDTRVKRVVDRLKNDQQVLSNLILEKFQNSLTMVCGSMWPEDSEMVFDSLQKLKQKNKILPNIIWVPHELDFKESKKYLQLYKQIGYYCCLYEELNSKENDILNSKSPIAVFVVKKGILVELYKSCNISFVGGGNGPGLHSVWEPCLSGSVIACGPKIERSPEAQQLLETKTVSICHNSEELALWIDANRQNNNIETKFKLEKIIAFHMDAPKKIIDICTSL